MTRAGARLSSAVPELAVTTSNEPAFDARPVLAALVGRLPPAVQAFAATSCWFVTVRHRDTTGGFTQDLSLEARRVARLQARGVAVPGLPADVDADAAGSVFLIYLTPIEEDERGARIVAHEVAHAWARHHHRDEDLAVLEREADALADRWLAEGPGE